MNYTLKVLCKTGDNGYTSTVTPARFNPATKFEPPSLNIHIILDWISQCETHSVNIETMLSAICLLLRLPACSKQCFLENPSFVIKWAVMPSWRPDISCQCNRILQLNNLLNNTLTLFKHLRNQSCGKKFTTWYLVTRLKFLYLMHKTFILHNTEWLTVYNHHLPNQASDLSCNWVAYRITLRAFKAIIKCYHCRGRLILGTVCWLFGSLFCLNLSRCRTYQGAELSDVCAS